MRYLSTTRNIIIGLLGISAIIVVHEFGHYVACVLFGVPVNTFSIGFGPALFGITIGGTYFQVAALPLGGYVDMNIAIFEAQPFIAKFTISLAGVVFNILSAVIVLIYLGTRPRYKPIPVIDIITENSPAAKGDLQPGDRILRYNDIPVDSDYNMFVNTILRSPGKELVLTIMRDNQQLDIPVTLARSHPIFGAHVGWLGVQWQYETLPPASWREGIAISMQSLAQLMQVFTQPRRKRGERDVNIIGPIGLLTLTGKSYALGMHAFLLLLAWISINVGIFNLLPIPFFDGGRALQYTIEAIFGKLPQEVLNTIYTIFLLLLLFFVMLITMADIRRMRR